MNPEHRQTLASIPLDVLREYIAEADASANANISRSLACFARMMQRVQKLTDMDADTILNRRNRTTLIVNARYALIHALQQELGLSAWLMEKAIPYLEHGSIRHAAKTHITRLKNADYRYLVEKLTQ